MAAESRAKITYEYLMKFTDDPYVKETLTFLMTREIAHFQMFEAALDTIKPNFPPGVLQGDPRYSNKYFNMSDTNTVRGPWNKGQSTQLGEDWQYIENPLGYVHETQGLSGINPEGTPRTMEGVKELDQSMSELRSTEINAAAAPGEAQWSTYEDNGNGFIR